MMPAARPSAPLVPKVRAIQALAAGLEKGCELRHSKLEDGVKAPRWVEIRKDAKHHPKIEGQLKAMGYTYSHGHKYRRVSRDLKMDSPSHLEPDLRREYREETPASGPNDCGRSSPTTLRDFIMVAKKARAKSRHLPLKKAGPNSDMESAHRGAPLHPCSEVAGACERVCGVLCILGVANKWASAQIAVVEEAIAITETEKAEW